MLEKRSGSTTTSPPSGKQPHGVGLACRECQRKKIKCDRHYPCGACARGALVCVPSTRKPRAKVGARVVDAELRARIAKLEKLVHQFQGDEDEASSPTLNEQLQSIRDGDTPPGFTPTAMASPRRESSDTSTSTHSAAVNKYMAGNFWSSLTSEVQALKDIFEDGGQSDDEGSSSAFTPPTSLNHDPADPSSAVYELIFCPPGAIYVMPGVLNEPDALTTMNMTDIYIENMEPMQKLFHVPTLKAFTHEGLPYLGREPDAPCNLALKACIWFTAITSLQDDECIKLYSKPRHELAHQFRQLADIRLQQADPLNTLDIATVQAMALYVGTTRILDTSRKSWSLAALLVRIGRALDLHRELPGESVFSAQIRRRLWHNIIFLDSHSAFDRGTEPCIHPDSFTRPPPLNVNDADFSPESTSLFPRVGEITEISMPLLAQKAALLILLWSIPEGQPGGTSWQQRLEAAYGFRKSAQETTFQYLDQSIQFHRVIAGIGTIICHSVILQAVRPISTHSISSPPRVDSPWVMELAVNILRSGASLGRAGDDPCERRLPWVPWHALAVTLAGLCSTRDTPLSNEAWSLVDGAMALSARMVADSSRGSLWRPLERLYKKAAAFREQGISISPDQFFPNTAQLPPTTISPAAMPPRKEEYSEQLVPGDAMLPGLTDVSMGSFLDFPPDIHATLPSDTSWLDWEDMVKNMETFNPQNVTWS